MFAFGGDIRICRLSIEVDWRLETSYTQEKQVMRIGCCLCCCFIYVSFLSTHINPSSKGIYQFDIESQLNKKVKINEKL